MYVCVYIYIYIYIYTYAHVYMCLVGPGNSLDVSVTFPSFTFPLRFHHVSVTFPSAFPLRVRHVSGALQSTFPLRFRWASACQTGIAQKLAQHMFAICFWPRAAEQIPSKTRFGKVVPTSPVNTFSQSTFLEGARRCIANDHGPERQMRREPKGRINSSERQRFHHVSISIFATFPQRFRQRFRRISVNVCVSFPLGRCVPDGNYPKTLPTFPGPTKYMCMCICVCVHVCVHIYIYIYIYILFFWGG